VTRLSPAALVVRTSAFFGPWDDSNFVAVTLAELGLGRPVRADAETVISPTYVPDLVDASLDLLVDGASGIWHLAGAAAVTWAELARRSAAAVGLSPSRVVPVPRAEMNYRAARPALSALTSSRAALMPPLEESLERYARAQPRPPRPRATLSRYSSRSSGFRSSLGRVGGGPATGA
jgi:dTDP-4-dehydrorhamnose reductase